VGYRPTDPQIAWHLPKFIENVRGISLAPVLMRHDWLSAYDFTTTRGSQFLGDYARVADPFAKIGERTVPVQVTSVVRASDRSFRVKWDEAAYEHRSEADSSHWTGILTILTKPAVSADALRKNPLGIYIDAVDWSREFEPAAPARTAPPPSNVPLGSPLDPNLAARSTVTPETQP